MRLPWSGFASKRRWAGRGTLRLLVCAVTVAAVAQPSPWNASARKARAEAFVAARGSSLASLPVAGLALTARPKNASSFSTAWQPLGPVAVASARFGKVSGRVTAIALDPADATANTVYVGTTGGGVWKSVNAAGALGAVQFTPLTDTLPVFAANAGTSVLPSLSIGAVSVGPAPSSILLAGTGDPNDATDSYYGEGILRSADGGQTWTLATFSDDGANGTHSFVGLGVAGFAWSTVQPQLVVAALSSSAEGDLAQASVRNSIRGLYYSTDAGVTWKMATLYDGATVVQEPKSPGTAAASNAVTAVVWDAVRRKFYAAVRQHGFYESADGATWTRMASQPGTGLTLAACPSLSGTTGAASCPLFRGALAVQPVTGDLFALSVDAQNNDNGLWQDVCAATSGNCAGPVSFVRIDAGQMEVGTGSTAVLQGDYNLTLAAAAQGSGTLLLAGTVDVYRCVESAGSTGCALRNTTNALNGCNAPAAVAPAQHALALAAPMVFLGNDGGLWRSADGIAETGAPCNAADAQHFENLNGAIGSLAEVVGFAQDPASADVLLAGLGALGTAATGNAAADLSARAAWEQMSEGEGGLPAIDPAQTKNWYAAIGAGVNWKACTKGSACSAADFAVPATVGYAQVAGDAALVDAAEMLDPAQTSNVLIGTCRVWRGPAGNGAAWSAANAISAPLGGGSVPCTGASAMVSSLGAGGPAASVAQTQNSGATVLYAGMAGRLDGGGGAVGGHVFLTTAGATADSATKWTDLGASPVSNDTANAHVFNPYGFAVSSVVVDAHDATGATVYATVLGMGGDTPAPRVYRSTDFGAHWTNISANLPAVPVNALLVDPNDANTVYAALDSGVYATQQVTTCGAAGTNCWSLLGVGLPQSPVTALAASAAMLTGDGRQGMLRAGTYGRGLWALPLLTATALPQPALAVAPTGLTFTLQAVNSQSTAQQVTVSNTGNVPITIASINVTGDFVETDNCTAAALAVAASCTVNVVFAPTAAGTRSGQLAIAAPVPGSPLLVALQGTGATPAAVVLAPSLLTFATTTVGQSSAAQTVTITNTGGLDTALSAPTLAGDFALNANTCGATLAAGASCTVGVVFTPSAGGARSGTLRFTDSAGTQTATLAGTGVMPASITLTPPQLTFAATTVGQTSAAQSITLTNTGGLSTPLSNLGVSAGFTLATNTCGAALAAGASCVVGVVFAPGSAGAFNGSFHVTDDAGTQTTTLTGVANLPASLTLTPGSLTFAATIVGQTAAAQIVTLANTGGTAAAITSVAVSGDFHVGASTCGSTLAASTACAVSITFSPTASGSRNGVLTVIDDAGTQLVSLTGTGTAPATDTLAPLALTFAAQQVGTTSSAQQVMLTNAGDVALTLVSATIGSGPFTAVSACGTSLAAHASCAVSVAFVPAVPGSASGVLTVSDQFRTQTVSLNGTGLAPAGVSLTPAAGLSFGATGVGLTSAAQSLTLTNNGGVALNITGVTANGDFLVATNSCGASLAPATACTLQVVFVPKAAGARSGTLTLVDSAGTQTVALAGTGIDFALTANGPTSATLASGATASYSLQLSAPAGVTGTAALTCTGAPTHSICTVTPTSAALGGTVAVSVSVQTGTSKAALEKPRWSAGATVWLALMLPLGLLARRRRPAVLLSMVLLFVIAGCGAGRQIPPGGIDFPTQNNTPAGTYTLTVSASSAGLTRSVPLTLVVQ